MRAIFLLWAVLLGASVRRQEQGITDPCSVIKNDPYEVGMVSKALRIASQEIYSTADERELFPVSPDGRGIVQVGDAVSVAILKIVNLKELTQKETATAYLRVVHMAFYAPEKILLASDREPKVTLSLLGYLQDHETDDLELERRIAGHKELCPKTDVRSTGPMISGTWLPSCR